MASYTSKHDCSPSEYVLQELTSTIAESARQAAPLIEKIRQMVPFDEHLVSGLDIVGCEVGCGIYLSTSLPKDFTELYTRERYFEQDPLFKAPNQDASLGASLCDWHSLSADTIDKAPELGGALQQYKIAPRSGVLLWNADRLYGAALFTREAPFTADEMALLQWLGASLHTTLAAPVVAEYRLRFKLTKSEIACLQWASKGFTSEEIAGLTEYTVETVNFYLKSVVKKMKVHNRSAAIAEALRLGLIH
jgi:DNA-binding CsgD family transcriptional regulator